MVANAIAHTTSASSGGMMAATFCENMTVSSVVSPQTQALIHPRRGESGGVRSNRRRQRKSSSRSTYEPDTNAIDPGSRSER
uniref:Uncharacterized protein n=1 Tax=Zea mays TaxID=4577 RepID=A0A804PX66_MAIZE